MKIGLVGPSSSQRSIPFDAQRSINLFPVLDQMGKEVSALYSKPGLEHFATCGNGPIRGGFSSTNDRVFFVSGSTLYEVSTDGMETSLGTLSTSVGLVSIDENPTQLAICDGQYVYILTYSTNVFVKVSDIDLPTAGTITFIDGYFVVNSVGTGRFYISSINDGTTWASLDFATAESSPDELVRVLNAAGQLWLLGSKNTEVWNNTGDSTFPFERISSSAKISVGILAAHSAVEVDNSIFWIGKDNIGSGIVYKAAGFSAQRISTNAIEYKIQQVTDIANIKGYTYQEEGHVFYVLTGGGLETALVYDLSTDLWHERAYLDSDGSYNQPLETHVIFAFGTFHLAGSRVDGKIYKQSMNYYSDDGDEIVRDRIYTHFSDEDKRIRYTSLVVSMETGVGLQSGQGSDPIISLRVSKDMGRTWSNWYQHKIGKVGKYNTKVSFNRIGVAECVTFNLRITDPIKVCLVGSYLSAA